MSRHNPAAGVAAFLLYSRVEERLEHRRDALSEEGSSSSPGTPPGGSCLPDRRCGYTLSSHPSDDTLCRRRTPRISGPSKGQRHRQPADGGSYPGGQGQQGSRCHAQPEAARRTVYLLARPPAQAEGVALSRQPLAHIQSFCDHRGPMECLPRSQEMMRVPGGR